MRFTTKFEQECIKLAGFGDSIFEDFKYGLFRKYNLSGEKAMYALALAMSQCSDRMDIEDALVPLIPLITNKECFLNRYEYEG